VFPALLALAVHGEANAITLADCVSMGSACAQVGTPAALATALGNSSSTATTILLTAAITIASGGMTVNQAAQARQNLVIDGGGFNLAFDNFAFLMAQSTTNNPAWAWQNATLTLQNFGNITSSLAIASGTVSRLVYAQDAGTNLSVALNNINSMPDGKLVAMGLDVAAAAPNINGRVIFGNIASPITLTLGTFRQSVLSTNITGFGPGAVVALNNLAGNAISNAPSIDATAILSTDRRRTTMWSTTWRLVPTSW
jgi:autotransporter family porin